MLARGYLSLRDAAAWASVSVRTVERWLLLGLPTSQVTPRGRRLVRVADLDTFLAGKRRVQKQELNALVEDAMKQLGVRGS